MESFQFVHHTDHNFVYQAFLLNDKKTYLVTWFSKMDEEMVNVTYTRSEAERHIAEGTWIAID